MREIDLSGYKMTVQGGPWAVFLYKREFKSDFFADYREAISHVQDDISTVDALFLLRAVWVMASTAADADGELSRVPPFERWLKTMPDLPMTADVPWGGEVISAIFAELFRIDLDKILDEESAEGRNDGGEAASGGEAAGL